MSRRETKGTPSRAPVVLDAANRIVGGPRKLSEVVTDAVRRWFLEAQAEAYQNDVKAMALYGNMLIQGYGCKADPAEGRAWVEKARRRGYRMQGVYCVI